MCLSEKANFPSGFQYKDPDFFVIIKKGSNYYFI